MLTIQLLLLLLSDTLLADKVLTVDKLTWRQLVFYQSRWPQRRRFITTPKPGTQPESPKLRKVYPCYCYKPPKPGNLTTEAYEKYMIEPKKYFILNK
ncbi:uncharacterized protein LOC6579649 [Drosophila mojavensis]|uniref:Uncharacterized protein n=1 Tax=Drosophila mojavensis TaxID=7230 RepID=B4KSG1_DROMO|nr:uncharacterized protein LOC6579649 [Drosophila mojavensis]EDW09466.1 uncharacterized protein Dmoj_GI19018 [Drosophila mojavensis]